MVGLVHVGGKASPFLQPKFRGSITFFLWILQGWSRCVPFDSSFYDQLEWQSAVFENQSFISKFIARVHSSSGFVRYLQCVELTSGKTWKKCRPVYLFIYFLSFACEPNFRIVENNLSLKSTVQSKLFIVRVYVHFVQIIWGNKKTWESLVN